MAVSAHVITMGLENDINGNIKAWFKQFNFLPPIPLTAAQVDTVSHPLSFEHLLELVLQSTYTNFILIIHGQPDGSGLYLPLFAHSSKYSTFHYDLQKLMDVDADVSRMSEADFRVMGFAPLDAHTKTSLKQNNRKDPRQERVDRMLDLMHQVRNKKIDCIEFRSCNLGKNVLSLQRFRDFFGARLAGAPDLHTVFGRTDTRVGDKFLKIHMKNHPITNGLTLLGDVQLSVGSQQSGSCRRTAHPAATCLLLRSERRNEAGVQGAHRRRYSSHFRRLDKAICDADWKPVGE